MYFVVSYVVLLLVTIINQHAKADPIGKCLPLYCFFFSHTAPNLFL